MIGPIITIKVTIRVQVGGQTGGDKFPQGELSKKILGGGKFFLAHFRGVNRIFHKVNFIFHNVFV